MSNFVLTQNVASTVEKCSYFYDLKASTRVGTKIDDVFSRKMRFFLLLLQH